MEDVGINAIQGSLSGQRLLRKNNGLKRERESRVEGGRTKNKKTKHKNKTKTKTKNSEKIKEERKKKRRTFAPMGSVDSRRQ